MAKDEPAAAKKRDASDVYDRQIRLWGKEAQEKMAKAKVLYIHVTGVSSEVLKNLVLAGIRATICDNRPFPSAAASTPSFLLPPSTTGEPAAKKTKFETVGAALKPVVENLNLLLGDCGIIDKDVSELDAELLKEFPIVMASRIPPSEALRLSKIVTAAGNKFFLADCFGLYGSSLMDLGEHTFQISGTPPVEWMRYRLVLEYFEQTKRWPTADDADDFVTRSKAYLAQTTPNLPPHPVLQEESLKTLASMDGEFAPVCAVLGGLLGNEVIKAISGKGEPANNTLHFSADTCEAITFLVHSKANPDDDENYKKK
ncbi:activating enzyme subunit 1 [Seminavis robusta]|uniref:Activating enzyme subunit 1 n=1 Tax=Seminavis robusta TaxID=568900 RepID=A0A9N8H455_9STRA|nr:activating enzyme subunit 1 [Seminavis robusta]|eukprot:Sro41_g025240.1 activating enzyme subunit 1 (314) ;mRNA; f:87473-88620